MRRLKNISKGRKLYGKRQERMKTAVRSIAPSYSAIQPVTAIESSIMKVGDDKEVLRT
jgi:hypothetical protein